MQERFKVSVRRSCRLARLQPSVWYAKSQAKDQSALRQRIRDIALSRPRFGYERVLVMLRLSMAPNFSPFRANEFSPPWFRWDLIPLRRRWGPFWGDLAHA